MGRSVTVRAALISIILIVVLGSLLYINSLNGEFVYDDQSSLGWGKRIADRPFSEKMRSIFQQTRSLTTSSLIWSYYLWGDDVRGYHITNLVLHILVALSVFWLIIILFDDWALATLAGILFVAHPAQTESVAFISNRGGVMSALFSILCLIFYIKNTRTKNIIFFVLTILSAACALLSKEEAIIIPALLMLFHFSFKERFNWGLFLSVALTPFIGVLALRVVVGRLQALPWFIVYGHMEGLLLRTPGFFAAVASYARILLLPINLRMQYGQPLFSFTDPRVLVGLAVVVLSLGYAFQKRNENRLIFFSVCWFFVALLPATSIFPDLGAYMREHWLYLPSVGFCLLLAYCLSFLYRNKTYRTLAVLVFFFIMVFYSYLTVKQNTYWRNYTSITERILQITPRHGQANNALGRMYVRAGKVADAIPLFKKAIKAEPGDAVPYNNLGNTYFILGRYREALDAYRDALRIAPYYAKVYSNIGEVYSALGQHEAAIAAYKRAIKLIPEHRSIYGRTKKTHQRYTVVIKPRDVRAIAQNNLGIEYSMIHKPDEAEDAYKKAIKIAPWKPDAYFNLGDLYAATGRTEEAIDAYKKAIKKRPDDLLAHKHLGNVYSQAGRTEDALVSYKRVLELDPYDAGTYYNISLIFFREKKYEAAVKFCDRSMKLGYRVPPSFLEKLKPYRK